MKKGDKIIKPGDTQIFNLKIQFSHSKKQFIYNTNELNFLMNKLVREYLGQKYYNKYKERLTD